MSKGMVDEGRIGIVGFSRSCYYVLKALTTEKFAFKAASISDGVNEGYLQYMTTVDQSGNAIANEAERMNGARPFGAGLPAWLDSAPTFRMDRVTAPLLVMANGPRNLLFMWEPYAALRYLHKPVELVMVYGGTHLLTNPSQRMISQGGNVDWFRFWLQDYEDPDPAKAEQYERWKKLREVQQATVH